ncbi:MAG: deoxyribonuclease [Methanopyri archaeon]|nr:deoxyribonuclease [Methanopyri archaeon]
MGGAHLRYVDAHLHLDVRSYEDLEKMALAGIRHVVTCAHDPYPGMTREVYEALYRRLIEIETMRGERAGLKVHVAIGVHPGGIPEDLEGTLETIEKHVEKDEITAIGETGLNAEVTPTARKALEAQLDIAHEYDLPIIVHTPGRNKEEVTREVLKILAEHPIDGELVLVDHASPETAPEIAEEGYAVGLTLRPGELTVEEAADIVENLADGARLVASSDLGSMAADPLALPRLALELERRGVEKATIRAVVHDEAASLYRIRE